MEKLLISTLKFFSLSAVKFFLLRFNNFTSFSYTSSVIISLEFVFAQFPPDIRREFALSVFPTCSCYIYLLTCWSNIYFLTGWSNRSPRSFGHGRRRQTDRQAFSLGVIDMYSVCFAKHTLECGVIVLHVLEEPLLGELRCGLGRCVGLDVSLLDVVGVGLIPLRKSESSRENPYPFRRSAQARYGPQGSGRSARRSAGDKGWMGRWGTRREWRSKSRENRTLHAWMRWHAQHHWAMRCNVNESWRHEPD